MKDPILKEVDDILKYDTQGPVLVFTYKSTYAYTCTFTCEQYTYTQKKRVTFIDLYFEVNAILKWAHFLNT